MGWTSGLLETTETSRRGVLDVRYSSNYQEDNLPPAYETLNMKSQTVHYQGAILYIKRIHCT